ncbi:MAG: phage shock protein B [Gammaproteobacteria bacterium]|jgi:phage shock protein B
MVSIIAILFVPVILFLVIVAPIWLFLHYRDKGNQQTGLSDADRKNIDEIIALADTMEKRMQTLESILDNENPHWRENQ